jgi:hypothetical protein
MIAIFAALLTIRFPLLIDAPSAPAVRSLFRTNTKSPALAAVSPSEGQKRCVQSRKMTARDQSDTGGQTIQYSG